MKDLILSLMIALAPLAGVPMLLTSSHALAATSSLGDLSGLHAIVADTLAIARTGDFDGAEKRITDFESTWDASAPTMRAIDTASWTMIDHVADAAIESLRAATPTADTVVPALDKLLAALGTPGTQAAASSVPAFSLTNADGSPVPCEVALEEVRRVSAATPPAAADQAKFDELQSKGTERCNADDDKRADNFFGEALALLGH